MKNNIGVLLSEIVVDCTLTVREYTWAQMLYIALTRAGVIIL